MPIRMREDDPQSSRGKSTGGSGNLLKWVLLALFFVFKKPKIAIPLLLLAGAWYFFMGGQEMLQAPIEDSNADAPDLSEFNLGASLSEERFDKASVFEPLAYSTTGFNDLPPAVSLKGYAPSPQHQGSQGSCVGWASAYAARTILEARARGKKPDETAFSPAYLYNQIHLDDCNGAYMLDAMQSMQENGALPFAQFSYDERSCANYPDRSDIANARPFRIKGFNRLTLGDDDYRPDIEAIKQNLAQGAPVVIGAMVGGTFMSRMVGQKVWRPSSSDYGMRNFGGHAMCVVGYDDNMEGGAFHIMNSWGQDWGDRGFCWMKYDDFSHFVREAYGLFPMGAAGDKSFDPNKLAIKFGLFDVENEALIPLRQRNGIRFRTERPIRIGSKFKVLLSNSVECYTYVLGQETDGSSYVLFPYTAKHSPYCGITGTRLFPKDYHMTPDEVGNRDYIAIVVSKDPLDPYQLNTRMNGSQKRDFADKIQEALAAQLIGQTEFVDGSTIAFTANLKEKGRNAVALVLEIEKQ